MASLKDIKLKIHSYKKTGTVTHAMEAVSAVKMRKAQERALGGRSYAAAALTILKRLAGTADAGRHPLMRQSVAIEAPTINVNRSTGETQVDGQTHVHTYGPETRTTCFIVITSDKGLAGSLNSSVIRRVEEDIRARGLSKDDVLMIAVGRRGGDYFASRGFEVREKYENIADGVSEEDIRKITDTVLELHRAGEIGTCVVAYQNFLSTFEQDAAVRQILPITEPMVELMVKHIRPVKGKYAPREGEDDKGPAVYTIEPDADEVLAVLLPRLLNVAVFHAMLEAKASEHSARMVAMKNATDKAKEMAQGLTRTFNKVRQAAITREVSEITSGIEAMR